MDFIKLLFGTGDDAKTTLTPDEVSAAIKGMKLIDLSEGEYVAKEKFETADAKRKAVEADLKKLKDAGDGDEGLKSQIATLEREKAEAITRAEAAEKDLTTASTQVLAAQRADVVREKAGHLPAKMQRLLREDAEKLVTDEFDFAAAVDKVVADDEDYAAPADDGKPTKKVSTGGSTKARESDEDEATAAVDAVFDTPKAAGEDK